MNMSLKRKGIIAGVAVLIIAAAVIVTTSLSSALSLDEAKEIARKHVPASATFVSSDNDSAKYTVIFYDSKKGETYEVEINKDTKTVKKIQSQLDNDLGSKVVKLSKTQAINIIKSAFPSVTSTSARLTTDNGLYEYEISFRAPDFYGSADVNAETGVINERTIKYGTATVIPMDDDKTPANSKNDNKIKENPSNTAPNGSNNGNASNNNNNNVQPNNNSQNDVQVNNNSQNNSGGQTYNPPANHNNGPSTNNNVISASQARSIVLNKVPGATITELELDRDDGRYVYEGEARKGSYEYSFEIDAASGVIIGWESEYEDDYDEWDD